MVLVEELDEEEPVTQLHKRGSTDHRPAPQADKKPKERRSVSFGEDAQAKEEPATAPKKEKTELKKGFLDSAKEPLYPAEGSNEGYVSPDTHKAHAEEDMNKKFQKDMNRGADNNNGYNRPDWYTKDWPKDCQYNSPGCALEELETTGHASDLHRKMVRENSRWEDAFTPKATTVRLCFMQLTDEDLVEVIKFLKGNQDILELDLTHNHIKDKGIQSMVAALAGGAAPNLRELRIYRNEFGDLGKTMITQGLSVLRKKLEVKVDEPDWSRLARINREEEKESEAAAAAAPSEASTADASGMD